MSVILENYAPPDATGPFELDVRISATVEISALQARRLVNRYFMNYVGNLLHGVLPETLVVENEHIYWQVPIVLSKGREGSYGTVGAVRVDVKSGELIITDELIAEIKQNAHRIVASASPQPVL